MLTLYNIARFGAPGTTTTDEDFLVELRGFKPLTSAVQASARLTVPALPRVNTTEGWSLWIWP
jgi:hypothetical protein